MFAGEPLSGRRILVTGGGTGIGKSLATRFLELGAKIVICGRREAVLQAATEEWRTAGGVADYFVCDLRDPAAVEAMFDGIWAGGPLDGLVNNAAGNFIARTELLSSRAFDAVVDVVLHGSAYCSIAAGRRWIEAGRAGAILSIITSAAWQGRAFMTPSATSKAAVLSLMRSLAVEWGPKGIRTAAVSPGIFPTPGASARLYPDPAEYEAQVDRIPVGRVGRHEELANLCAYLLSDYASFINGDCITMDGGAALLEGGGGTVQYLRGWGADQWEEFRTRSKRLVAEAPAKA
jgi:NAD(P)-dependent dehydrogenase (short-subunit alcohol dehydrogenase family)